MVMSSKNDLRPHLWVPVVAYMTVIFYASSLTDPPVPSNTDKPLHWLAYLGLSVLVVRALAGGLPRPISRGIAAAAVAITVTYGATDEVHQMFVPGRTADVYDLMADAAGALVGTGVCVVWGFSAQGSRHKSQGSSHNRR
jgi:VanZ family protein